MISPGEKELLDAFKGSLARRFAGRLGELILFGSRARGEGRDDSDLDVRVGILDLTRNERLEVIDLAADLSVEHDLVLSPLVVRLDARGGMPDDASGSCRRLLEGGLPL